MRACNLRCACSNKKGEAVKDDVFKSKGGSSANAKTGMSYACTLEQLSNNSSNCIVTLKKDQASTGIKPMTFA